MSEDNGFINFLSDPTTLAGLAAIAAATAWYLSTRPQPLKPPVPLDNQSLELPGGDRVRTSHFAKNNELVTHRFDDARTLYQCFQRGKRVSNNGKCLGWRPGPKEQYKWVTYAEVEQRARNLGAGLKHLGVDTGQDTYVGIYSLNNVNWVVTEQSCNTYSRPLVPLYDTLGPDAVSYIIGKACISAVVCYPTKVSLLLKQAASCPSLRLIVTMGTEVTDKDREEAEKAGLTIHTISDVERMGADEPVDPVPPSPDDIATVCFTSGTTGNPKGAILTHGNIISNMSAAYIQLESNFVVSNEDVHISYLPLAHMMERITVAMILMSGARLGFYQGDIKLLIDDIQTLRPTLFVSVPRLLNRVYDKVIAGVSGSAVKKWLFERALASKLAELKCGICRRDSIWDYLVFRKVQNSLGGRVRFILTGSAPISEKVMNFLRCGFGCQVFEGYGQTECTAGCSLTLPGDCTTGHVGPPLCCSEIKLVDVKDMSYYSANGEGEVCIKGPNVFQGYLKDQERTAEALDEDGWLHTGDIGRWLPNGTLKIVDRKKHIFKLAQGEYVAPEKVENIYVRSKYVAQAYLFGDSLKAACVAIIIPDEELLRPWAEENGRSGTFEELCKDEEVKKLILADITKVGKELGLHSFEQAKAIMLYPEPFSVENGLLTPTFKMKRVALKAKFLEAFVQLYRQLDSS